MLTLAVLGSIESLLCARVSDTMTDDRHDPNPELMGQGVANMIVPFFGGIPATGTIARTVTNIKSGAASPVAGMVHAVTLLVVILAAAPLASNIPLSALAAGPSGHPLKQLQRTGIAQALGPNLAPNMEFALARVNTVLAELDEKDRARAASHGRH